MTSFKPFIFYAQHYQRISNDLVSAHTQQLHDQVCMEKVLQDPACQRMSKNQASEIFKWWESQMLALQNGMEKYLTTESIVISVAQRCVNNFYTNFASLKIMNKSHIKYWYFTMSKLKHSLCSLLFQRINLIKCCKGSLSKFIILIYIKLI